MVGSFPKVRIRGDVKKVVVLGGARFWGSGSLTKTNGGRHFVVGTTQNYHFFGRRPLATVFWNLFEIENKKRVLKVEIDCV